MPRQADNIRLKGFLNNMCVENALALIQRSKRNFLLVEFEYLIQRHKSQFIYKTQNSCSALAEAELEETQHWTQTLKRVPSNKVANCTPDGCPFTKACARTFPTARMASRVTQETFRLQIHISITLLRLQSLAQNLFRSSTVHTSWIPTAVHMINISRRAYCITACSWSLNNLGPIYYIQRKLGSYIFQMLIKWQLLSEDVYKKSDDLFLKSQWIFCYI